MPFIKAEVNLHTSIEGPRAAGHPARGRAARIREFERLPGGALKLLLSCFPELFGTEVFCGIIEAE